MPVQKKSGDLLSAPRTYVCIHTHTHTHYICVYVCTCALLRVCLFVCLCECVWTDMALKLDCKEFVGSIPRPGYVPCSWKTRYFTLLQYTELWRWVMMSLLPSCTSLCLSPGKRSLPLRKEALFVNDRHYIQQAPSFTDLTNSSTNILGSHYIFVIFAHLFKLFPTLFKLTR